MVMVVMTMGQRSHFIKILGEAEASVNLGLMILR